MLHTVTITKSTNTDLDLPDYMEHWLTDVEENPESEFVGEGKVYTWFFHGVSTNTARELYTLVRLLSGYDTAADVPSNDLGISVQIDPPLKELTQ